MLLSINRINLRNVHKFLINLTYIIVEENISFNRKRIHYRIFKILE